MVSQKAFTLVELLVAVMILAVVSSAAVFSLGGFSTKMSEETVRNRISLPIADFDRAIRDGSIGSYQMSFSSGALGYVSITDFSGPSASGSLRSFDWNTSSGVFAVSAPSSGQWTVRLAQDNKIVRTVSVKTATIDVPFSFETGRRESYSASFFFDSDPQNRIVMAYFDRDNLLMAEEFRLRFVGASV